MKVSAILVMDFRVHRPFFCILVCGSSSQCNEYIIHYRV
jgi:hypothetical protein